MCTKIWGKKNEHSWAHLPNKPKYTEEEESSRRLTETRAAYPSDSSPERKKRCKSRKYCVCHSSFFPGAPKVHKSLVILNSPNRPLEFMVQDIKIKEAKMGHPKHTGQAKVTIVKSRAEVSKLQPYRQIWPIPCFYKVKWYGKRSIRGQLSQGAKQNQGPKSRLFLN